MQSALTFGKISENMSPVKNAFKHWKDHKNEFPDIKNAKQYVEASKKFLKRPPKGTLTKTRSNGDILRYDPKSNTFGVMTKDGVPRTMFKPKNKIKY